MQAGALVLAWTAPLIGNALFYLGSLSITPTALIFLLSGGVIGGLIRRKQFLDLVPISRAVVIDSIETGVMTVHTAHRVIDINGAARRLLNVDGDDRLIGQHIDTVLADQQPMRESYWSGTEMDSGTGWK